MAVTDWAHQLPSETSGVWFSLDANSAGRLPFWQGALQIMQDARLLSPGDLLSSVLSEIESLADLRRALIRGFVQYHHPVTLIIDNLHLASDSEILDDFVALLEAAANLRVVALTRSRSELEGDALRARLGTQIIDMEHLAFTAQETAQLVCTSGLDDPDGTLANALHGAVGGFPLTSRGVLILMQRKAFTIDRESALERLASAGAEVLRNFWAMQEREDLGVDFIIRCSVPESLTPELAVLLSGCSEATTLLNAAESLGIGLWRCIAGEWTFTFTEVIRAELCKELERLYPHEVKGLHKVIAKWNFENGNGLAALRHAIDASDFKFAASVIVRDYWDILQMHLGEIAEILGGLPLGILRKNPLITMLLAVALNASGAHRIRALELFALAVVGTRLFANRVEPLQKAVLLTIENSAFRVTGQTRLALSAAERTIGHYGALTLDHKDELREFAPTLLTQTGLSFFYAGRTQKALELFETAYAHPRPSKGIAHVHALALAAGTHAINGDMPAAQSYISAGQQASWSDEIQKGYPGALYQLAKGTLALEAGEFQSAYAYVELMGSHLDTIEHWPLFMQLQAMAMLGMGQEHEAVAILDDAMKRSARPATSQHAKIGLDATRALLLTAAGRLWDAERLLKQYPKRLPVIVIAKARMHLARGNPDGARQVLQPLEGTSMPIRLRAELVLLHAAIALRLGEDDLALNKLATGLTLLDHRQLRMPLWLIPAADQSALASAATGRSYPLLSEVGQRSLLHLPSRQVAQLTKREYAVLHALVSSGASAEIADGLFVSVNTVKTQLRSLYKKLGASSREEALRYAREQGLLQ